MTKGRSDTPVGGRIVETILWREIELYLAFWTIAREFAPPRARKRP